MDNLYRLTRIALALFFCSAVALAQPRATARREVPEEQIQALFAYDRSLPFELREDSVWTQDGVTILNVSYAGRKPERGRPKAYMVRATGTGSNAGVLFFHWYGRPNGNRTQFLEEAIALAKKGTTSLLFQGYFPWATPPVDAATDLKRVIDETIEVRRALDLLLAQPGVDAKRIGFVGHDYGAMYGAIAASVDKRIATSILIAGTGSFSRWSLDYWLDTASVAAKSEYRAALAPIDPITRIAQSRPATLLFQFARADEHITRNEALAFSKAAGRSTQVKWYPGEHAMLIEKARTDRHAWLTKHLRLKR